MKRLIGKLALSSTLAIAALGCGHPYYPPPPPPPPPQVPAGPTIIQIAERNGFSIGRQDGARAARLGEVFHPRRTRDFRVTPGYDPQMGPYKVYRGVFRRAFLNGYRRGYYR